MRYMQSLKKTEKPEVEDLSIQTEQTNSSNKQMESWQLTNTMNNGKSTKKGIIIIKGKTKEQRIKKCFDRLGDLNREQP